MTARSRETTATFNHPFLLAPLDGVQPAGTYRVVIDEDEIGGLSFLAYQRAATLLHTPAVATIGQPTCVFHVNAAALSAALDADARRQT